MFKKLFLISLFCLYIVKNNYSGTLWQKTYPKGYYLADEKVLIVPEAERYLNFVIIGLWPINQKYVFLPEIVKPKNVSEKDMIEIKKLIYWINFEFTHGNILRKLPSYTKIFVALPKSVGNLEKKFFLEYLKVKCAFTDDDIKQRIYFFNTNTNLHWAQDTSEIIGIDEKGRVIIGMAKDDFAKYLSAIEAMTRKYNSFFTIKWFEDNTSAEGGDEEIVMMSDGKPALLIGPHRIMRYIELQYNIPVDSKEPYKQWMVEEARIAFSNSVYGIPVHIIPEKLLYDKTLGTNEIFHLDMYLVVLPDKHRSRAFIPIYDKSEIMDILSREMLSKEFVLKCNEKYNAVAEQMNELGFEVVRIPFYDHPVRNPANVAKFRNRDTGKITILLGKYPYHLSENNKLSQQQKLQNSLYYLEETLVMWKQNPNKHTYINIFNAINNLFYMLEQEEKMPNPIAENQADIYRKYGYDVVLIQQYAWGSGGLHCSLLY
ncbi:MAG: hypothetical protein N2114_02775 [Candidatus Goldbacteria bacterium]|nr:hypothetical protein [Candidatus Goldiibacteriota bacterium]